MADVFMQFDAKALLKHKHVLFLGDSNIRAQYKDLTWLLNSNSLIPQNSLKRKLEESFQGDRLIERSKLHHGRDFMESRLYYDRVNETELEFIFLTRCYNDRLLNLFSEFKNKRRRVPDVIVINSCLWDLTRWGPKGVPEYKDNMVKLMRLMNQSLPKQCLVVWCTALPTAPHVKGGLIIKQIEFMQPMLRFEVMEANTFAREVVVGHGFDVLDNHYHNRMQMHRRAKDGVHYLPIPVRFMTNLLLTHIALTWDKRLPNRIHSVLLDKAVAMDCKASEQPAIKMPNPRMFSRIKLVSPEVPRKRGLKVTINPEQYGRQCNLLQKELPASSSLKGETSPKVKSVVQLPNQEPHAATGPHRRKRKKKKKASYQNESCHSYQPSTFYHPYPRDTPSFHFNGEYHRYGNSYPAAGNHDVEYY